MGFKEIERWISILMLQELSHQKPAELLKLSLVRTKFSELIALHSIYRKRKSEISMMCLFSVLDAMLDVPMEEALEDIALSEDVKSALIHEGGKLKPICDLMYAYENGKWEDVKQVSNRIKIKEEKVSACYLEAITFANDILSNFN
jgi:EAL and modified HD-GYP domain-containing signal transduction protein